MSDIARPYPAGTTPGGYAVAGQPEAKVFVSGKEPTITSKGDDKAHGGTDLAK